MSVGTVLYRTHAQSRGAWQRRELSQPVLGGVLALTLLAAALRFTRIGHQGFWFDEGNTALLVHFSPGRMLGQLSKSESTPPLYYCLAWVWSRVFGANEVGLRSLSAVAGVLTVPVAFAAARVLVSERAGVVVAALAACNPLLIWYSQEARAYSLLVLFAGLSVLTFLFAQDEPTPRRVALWTVASVLALATHYYAVLVVAPEAAWLLFAYRDSRRTLVGIAVVTVCGLALVPLAVTQSGHNLAGWIHTVALSRRFGPLIPQFLVGFQLPAQSVLEPLACALAAAGVVLLVFRGDAWERSRAAIAAALGVAGLLLMLLLAAVGQDDFLTRNLLALWLPAALVVASGFGARRAGAAGVVACVALCGIGVTSAIGVAVNRDVERPDWRGVARLLGPRPAPAVGGRAILVQHYRDLLPLSLYLPGLRFVRGSGAATRVSELDVVSFTSPPSPGFCWWGSACNLWPSRMQSAYHVHGFAREWRRGVDQFTVLRLVAPRPTRITVAEVARALHTTHMANDELLAQGAPSS